MKAAPHTCEGCARVEKRIADLEARLARIGAACGSPRLDVYTTRRGGPRPPGVSEERWRELAPGIPGARKPGRWWVVSVSAYDAWAAGQDAPAPQVSDGEPWDPHDVVADLGLRRAGGGQ